MDAAILTMTPSDLALSTALSSVFDVEGHINYTELSRIRGTLSLSKPKVPVVRSSLPDFWQLLSEA